MVLAEHLAEAHFSLPETLLAVCAGAVAGSLLSTRKLSPAVRVLFNTTNLMIASGSCWRGLVWHRG